MNSIGKCKYENRMKKMTFWDINRIYVEWSQEVRPLQQQSKWNDLWSETCILLCLELFPIFFHFQCNKLILEIFMSIWDSIYVFMWFQLDKLATKQNSIKEFLCFAVDYFFVFGRGFLLVGKSCATENGSNSLWARVNFDKCVVLEWYYFVDMVNVSFFPYSLSAFHFIFSAVL